MFDLNGVEEEIAKALDRKVPLKSGGHLVIDQTEAMTTIDVNTGAYVGHRNLEETIFRTNLEAAVSIARQLRLRNLGGIIIIDFIDMRDEPHRRAVLTALERALAGDRAQTHIVSLSPLGLVEMTRKRTRESLEHLLCEACPSCEGRGFIRTPETVCNEIFREIVRQSRQFASRELLILAHQDVVDRLLDEESATLGELEAQVGSSDPPAGRVALRCRSVRRRSRLGTERALSCLHEPAAGPAAASAAAGALQPARRAAALALAACSARALLAGGAAVPRARLIAARVPEHRAALEQLIREQTGLEVTFSQLTVRWGWYGPEAVFHASRSAKPARRRCCARPSSSSAWMPGAWCAAATSRPGASRFSILTSISAPRVAAAAGRRIAPVRRARHARRLPPRLLARWRGDRIDLEGGALRWLGPGAGTR